MRIEYTCEDGSKTLALWPSMALLHWLGRSQPTRAIENPELFKFYVVGPPVPGDNHKMFLTLVYAESARFEWLVNRLINPSSRRRGLLYFLYFA
jgi:hypothetical protein